MSFRPERSGFSLVEAILASFMLLTAVLMSASVFDSSLQAEASNEKRIEAALVAEAALAEIRHAANLNMASLKSTYDGREWSLAEYPSFKISTTVEDAELAVPCTVLETQYEKTASFPEPTGRYLKSSALKVDIEIAWQDAGSQSVAITEHVVNFSAASGFDLDLLLPSGAPATSSTVIDIPQGERQEFSVRARSGSQEVKDIQFTWYVEALTGFGSIDTVSRDGVRCIYRNAYRNFDDTIKFSPGACFLVVKATYQGTEAEARVRIENGA